MIGQHIDINVDRVSFDAVEGNVDLLPIQKYFFDQLGRDDFSQEFILKSKVELDLNTLQKVFDELSNVHDMLRASYKIDDDVEGGVVQEILPLNTCVCKIKEYFTDDLDNTVAELIKESKKSLNISGDLIKISLIHHRDDCYLVFVIHHLIVDGVSWSILLDDLTYGLNQVKEGKEFNLLRPYPYKNWVEDVRSLADNISADEKQSWMEVNSLLDDSKIKGESRRFAFDVGVCFDLDNLLMLSEEEYWALCVARAYKKTYGEDIIFNRESYGRDESLADVNRTIGWFTSQFPVFVDVNNENDNISLMNDV